MAASFLQLVGSGAFVGILDPTGYQVKTAHYSTLSCRVKNSLGGRCFKLYSGNFPLLDFNSDAEIAAVYPGKTLVDIELEYNAVIGGL